MAAKAPLPTRNANDLKSMLSDFVLTRPAHIVMLDGKRAVRFDATFKLDTKEFGWLEVRSRTYAVHQDNLLFQISFSDGLDDDCDALFNEVVATVRIR